MFLSLPPLSKGTACILIRIQVLISLYFAIIYFYFIFGLFLGEEWSHGWVLGVAWSLSALQPAPQHKVTLGLPVNWKWHVNLFDVEDDSAWTMDKVYRKNLSIALYCKKRKK